MTKERACSNSGALKRRRVRAASGNHCEGEQLGVSKARHIKSCKTNPFAPSLPNGAARCAFARYGAQRGHHVKSDDLKKFLATRRTRIPALASRVVCCIMAPRR